MLPLFLLVRDDMGLFSSKTKVSVSTVVSRVLDDRLIPNSVKTGAIKGILSDNQLVENIMEDLVSSMGAKGERLYRYGKTKYPYGAPTSRLYRSSDILGVTKKVLERKVQAEVTLDYAHYAPLNMQHYAWQHLCDAYEYNAQTNELVALSRTKGVPVYLEDIHIRLTQSSMENLTESGLSRWGSPATTGITPVQPYGRVTTTHSPITVDSAATEDYLVIQAVWEKSATSSVDGVPRYTQKVFREEFSFPMVSTEEGAEFIQVKYKYRVEASRSSSWGKTETGEYGEIITINYVNFIQYFTYQVGTGTYEELDALFNDDFDDLGSFFPFGYFRFNNQPTSTDPYSTEYKAQTKLMGFLNMNYAEVNAAINANPDIKEVNSALMMLMVPAVSSNEMENQYLFDFFKQIYLNTAAVTQGTPLPLNPLLSSLSARLYGNTASPAQVSLAVRDARFMTTLGFNGIYRKIVSGTIGKVGNHTSSGNGTTYYYRKQITPQLYEEIQVGNLRRTYNIDGSNSTTNNMIPLDHAITRHYSIPEREQLYARSLHYVFNSRHETKIKWYQQGWFGTVLIVSAAVWTIWSMGSDGGSALGAAIAAGTATAVDIAIAIAIMALEYVVVKVVAKLFVKLLGPEFAMALAVVAAAYGMYSGYGATAGSMDSMLAQNLLSVSNSMISEVSAGYKKDLELLKKEGEEFNLFAQAKMDELEKIQEELEGSRLLSPFTLFGESPDAYFNRTVHAGNIGVLGISAIENYCSMALRLPELTQTVDFGQA